MDNNALIIEPIALGYQVTLNRPAQRNALSLAMVEQLLALAEKIQQDAACRVLMLRGSGGHFCAGGDLADMLTAAQAFENGDHNAFFSVNRRYGELLLALTRLPCMVISLVEGAAMGGGLGLVAVSDLVIAHEQAKLAMPEVTLGLPPAQIAPFVADKIGLVKARQLALLSKKLSSSDAQALGLVDEIFSDDTEADQRLQQALHTVQFASPAALRSTKQLCFSLSRFAGEDCEQLLDHAAQAFSYAITRGDGPEGSRAFMEKRKPQWAEVDA